MNWRSIIFKNYGVKTALLLMAVFLWFFVVSSRDYTQVIRVPIVLTEAKEGKVLVSDVPDEAEVRFHGKGTSLLLLSLYGDARLELSISSISQYYDYPVRLEMIKWAPGINVEIMEVLYPDTIFIRLDEEITRIVEVQSMLAVIPSDGYVITEEVKLEPDSVTVTGAESIVKDLQFISSQVKDIEKATGPINTRLELVPPEIGNLILDPTEVRAFIMIEKIETKLFSSIPVHVISPMGEEPKFCEPSVVNVRIKGIKSDLDELKWDEIIVSVSSEGNPSGAGVFFPVVILPDGLEAVEIIPDSVCINYEEVDT